MNANFEKILGQCAAYAALLWYISLLVFPIGLILVLVVFCIVGIGESAGAMGFAIAALVMLGLVICLLLTIVVLALGPNQLRMRVLRILVMYALFYAMVVANNLLSDRAEVIEAVLVIAMYGVMCVTLVMAVRWIACWRQDRVAGVFIPHESWFSPSQQETTGLVVGQDGVTSGGDNAANIVSLSDAAVAEIKRRQSEGRFDPDVVVRISPPSEHDCGYSVLFDYPLSDDRDWISQSKGISIVVDRQEAANLLGKNIDYRDGQFCDSQDR